MTWSEWRAYFERNAERPLPPIDGATGLAAGQAALLAGSLARFQIGETGEGRIVREIAASPLPGTDRDYGRAVALFIKEEGRHARILALAVRALGGQLLATTWTKRAFEICRRLLGARLELLVLLVAEVVGIAFYSLLAARLPGSAIGAALAQIAGDERAHREFHREFFRRQAPPGLRRRLFELAFAAGCQVALLVVLCDHRRTLRALGIPLPASARWMVALARETGRLDTPPRPPAVAGVGAVARTSALTGLGPEVA
jgi:hypothetical protein